MSPPIAEIRGSSNKIRLIGEIEVGHEDNETLLIPETQQAAKALENLLHAHPNTTVTLTPDDHGNVTVEGIPVPNVMVETSESRVLCDD